MADEYHPTVDALFGKLPGLFASLRQACLKPDTPSPNGVISRVVMEWKGGALRHCCRTFPPSPPHTGRARFRAPGVPNSILPGFCAGVPFLPQHCSSGSSLLMGLVMRPTAACFGFTWNIE